MKKKVLLALTILALCITLVGCSSEKNKGQGQIDNQNQPKELEIGKYRVEKSNDSVIVTTKEEAALSITEYKFTNGAVSSASLTQKYSNSAVARVVYEEIEKDLTLSQQYSDISIDNDTITFSFKNEVIDAYKGTSQDTLYGLLLQTYSAFLEE